jgi:hypothetical protein
MKRLVIVSEEWGIYLGTAIGLGFWSLLDSVGQEAAVTFENKKEAIEYIRSWDENNDPAAFSFVEVECAADMYATISELTKAGLPERYVAIMLSEMVAEGRA